MVVSWDSCLLDSVRADADGEPELGPHESIEVTVTLAADADEESLENLVELGKRGCYVSDALRDDLSVEVSWTRS